MESTQPSRAADGVERRTVTGEVAADAIGVSRATVWKLMTSGELRSIKIGARRLVPIEAIDEFIARKLAEAGAA